MRLFLRKNGYDFDASAKARYDMVMRLAKGRLEVDSLADWIKTHVTEIPQ